jgi:hypothetical protein
MDQDIIWHAFKQSCTVKMIQRTALASPHSGTNERGQSLVKYHKFVKQARFSFVFMCVCVGGGGVVLYMLPSVVKRITYYWTLIFVVVYAAGQAFVIFQKREVAEMAVAKLDEGCLMLSNGRYGFTLFQHWCTSIKYFLLSGSTLPVEFPAKAFQFYQYYCPPQLKNYEVKPQTILHVSTWDNRASPSWHLYFPLQSSIVFPFSC